MSKRKCQYIEILLVCILLVLCVSLYKKHEKMELVTSKQVTQQKICYLTFDDGPSNNSEEILDILKKYDTKATFFLIGSEIHEDNRAIIERIEEEGHAIGLHSNIHNFIGITCKNINVIHLSFSPIPLLQKAVKQH